MVLWFHGFNAEESKGKPAASFPMMFKISFA